MLSFSPEAELHPHACLGPCDTSHRAQDPTYPHPPHSLSGKGSQVRNQPPLARPHRFQEANQAPTHSWEGSPVLQLPLGLQSHAALHQPPEKRVTGVGGTQSPLSSGRDLGSCVLVAARKYPATMAPGSQGSGLGPNPRPPRPGPPAIPEHSALSAGHVTKTDGQGRHTPVPVTWRLYRLSWKNEE